MMSWFFLQLHLFEVSAASTRHLVEALGTTAATRGSKERALSSY